MQAPGMQGQRWGDGWWEYLNVPSTSENSPPPMPTIELAPQGGSQAGVHLAWRNWCATSQPSALVFHFDDTHAPAITVPVPPEAEVAAAAPCTNLNDSAASTLYDSVVRRYDNAIGFDDVPLEVPHSVSPPKTSAASTATKRLSGVVSGQLDAVHGAGVVARGHGRVPGVVEVRTMAGQLVTTVRAAPSGFRVRVPPGSYQVSASINDGGCIPADVVVTRSAESPVTLACKGGLSTG